MQTALHVVWLDHWEVELICKAIHSKQAYSLISGLPSNQLSDGYSLIAPPTHRNLECSKQPTCCLVSGSGMDSAMNIISFLCVYTRSLYVIKSWEILVMYSIL